jgi:hypothetical protein
MASNISFNPMLTTSPQNSFVVQTRGRVQGVIDDDPVTRLRLKGGILASTENPIYGGIPITEFVPSSTGNLLLGPTVKWATALANVNGMCVFNQAYNGIIVPGGGVPTYGPLMSVMFFEIGTKARICVPISGTLAASVQGNPVNANVTWDFVNNVLTEYDGTNAFPCKILDVEANCSLVSVTSGVASWTTGTGALIEI